MANLISTRLVLASMKVSAHSLGIADISRETGITTETVESTVMELKAANLIKENTANRGTYFTRTPHRNAIQAFINGTTNELPGMTFTTALILVTPAATGTKVRMSEAGRRAYGPSDSNPYHLTGEVISSGGTYTNVKWSNGRTNDYRQGELELVVEPVTLSTPVSNTPTVQPWEVGMQHSSSVSQDSQYKAALEAIKNAPHAISWRSVPYGSNAKAMCANLAAAGLIKEHRDQPLTYFTRTPKRELIAAFLRGDVDLATLFATTPAAIPAAPAAPVISAPDTDDRKTDIVKILSSIKSAPHALHIDDMPDTDADLDSILHDLENAGLIKEHADESDCYFTRKPKRAAIQAFLEGAMTLDALMDGDEPTSSATTSAAAPTDTVAPPAPVAPMAPATDPVGDFQAAMIAIREITNAFLAKHGR